MSRGLRSPLKSPSASGNSDTRKTSAPAMRVSSPIPLGTRQESNSFNLEDATFGRRLTPPDQNRFFNDQSISPPRSPLTLKKITEEIENTAE